RCLAGCDPRDVLAELRRRGLIGGPAHDRPSVLVTAHRDGGGDSAPPFGVARTISKAPREASGKPVAQHIARRGITPSSPPPSRWAPSLRRPGGTSGPAIVARIDNIDGKLIGVHRTWLMRDSAGIWRRHDRAKLGRAAGGAVRLAPTAETLMVGEGIET